MTDQPTPPTSQDFAPEVRPAIVRQYAEQFSIVSARLDAALTLHQPDPTMSDEICLECRKQHPCPTFQTLLPEGGDAATNDYHDGPVAEHPMADQVPNQCDTWEHDWPAELDSDSKCTTCGLSYDQFVTP